MKTRLMLIAAACCAASPAAFAAEKTPAASGPEAKSERRVEKHIRVVTGDGGPARVMTFTDDKDLPKEIVTFLGVETAPADPALAAQLGLKRGMGLTVRRVVPDSPAAAALKEHDVLTKLNDQWLVTQHQLAVLVQSYNEGDEVAVTFIRGGKEQSAKVKLAKKERPKLAQFDVRVPGMEGLKWTESLRGVPGGAGDLQEHLRALRESHGGGQHDVIIRRNAAGAPAPRISILRMPQSVMLFKDEAGAVELKNENGKQVLEVRDPKDQVTFNGDVSTPEQREKLPPDVRARLELVEAKDVLEFVPEGQIDVQTQTFTEGGEPAGAHIGAPATRRGLGNPVMRL